MGLRLNKKPCINRMEWKKMVSKKRLKEIKEENRRLNELSKKINIPEHIRNMTTEDLFKEIRNPNGFVIREVRERLYKDYKA